MVSVHNMAVWVQDEPNGLHIKLACDHPSAAAAQSNHRSWADFYLDVVATDGNAQMLSRMAVAYVFPMFMLAVCIIRSVVLFKRGEKVDHEARSNPLRAFLFMLAVCIIRSIVLCKHGKKVDHEARPAPHTPTLLGLLCLCWPCATFAALSFLSAASRFVVMKRALHLHRNRNRPG